MFAPKDVGDYGGQLVSVSRRRYAAGMDQRIFGRVNPYLRPLGIATLYIKNDADIRRNTILKSFGITTVIDAGANIGQYGRRLRKHGYRNKIISFEPLAEAFAVLSERVGRDGNWTAHHCGLGEAEATAEINVSRKNTWSSLLERDDAAIDPALNYVGTETIRIAPLDSFAITDPNTLLKLDVQGFEISVLKGATETLKRVKAIECEVTLEPAYKDQPDAPTLLNYFYEHGFKLVAVDNGRVRLNGLAAWIDVMLMRA